MKPSLSELNEIIACPNCKAPLVLLKNANATCQNCKEIYRWRTGTWELIPSSYRASSPLWTAWDQLQENGVVSYKNDPEHNLGVGEREDCQAFSRFCNFDGLVLDIGCGPQEWPAYFEFHSTQTGFIGVDPLIESSSSKYMQLKALGEYLPFRDETIDHVVFSTSLDHFINPSVALQEAKRVCKADGELDIWLGEKLSSAPRPSVSHSWYENLSKPDVADDFFHLHRLTALETEQLFKEIGLQVIETKLTKIDDYRSNLFYRLKP